MDRLPNITDRCAAHHHAAPKKRPKICVALRLAVYQRDGFACVGCGWEPSPPPPDYTGRLALLSWEGPGGLCFLELDHVIPWLYGGPTILANLQTLCTPCNRRKGTTGRCYER